MQIRVGAELLFTLFTWYETDIHLSIIVLMC